MKITKELSVLVMILVLLFSAGCTIRDTITGDTVADEELEMETESAGEEDVQGPEVEIVSMEASKIRSEYESTAFTDCGVYVRRNNEEANEGNYVDVYGCFNKALKRCEKAKAFMDVQTAEGARIVSFLSTANCKLTNHIKGNDPYGFVGEDMKTCESINPDLALQYACIDYTQI